MPITPGGAVQGDHIKHDDGVGLAESLFDEKRTQVLASGARIVLPAYKDLTSRDDRGGPAAVEGGETRAARPQRSRTASAALIGARCQIGLRQPPIMTPSTAPMAAIPALNRPPFSGHAL